MRGGQLEHVPVGRAGARDVLEREVLVDRLEVRRHREVGEGAHERVQLGGEGEAPVGQAAVEERLLAGPIAREEEPLSPGVPEREGEHARELRHAIGAVLLVEVQHDLAVAVRPEDVPSPHEVRAQLREVVDLAVDHDADRLVFVEEGLVGFRAEVDDREPPVPEHRAAPAPNPGGVGPAVGEGFVHAAHGGLVRSRVARDEARDAAHDACVPTMVQARERMGHWRRETRRGS